MREEAERAAVSPTPEATLIEKKVHWREASNEAVLRVPKAKAKARPRKQYRGKSEEWGVYLADAVAS